ncbi:MAG: hypothetical protein GY842_19975 [bacterium]|nr:hypothetical protein [bacterium]
MSGRPAALSALSSGPDIPCWILLALSSGTAPARILLRLLFKFRALPDDLHITTAYTPNQVLDADHVALGTASVAVARRVARFRVAPLRPRPVHV